MPVLVSASWIVPVGAPPISNGAVAVADGRITWVGARGDRDAPPGERLDLGAGVLMPGLVNAHCHLELSHLRGAIDGHRGFVPWVEELVSRRGSLDRLQGPVAAAAAIRALFDNGTAAVGDVSNTLDHVEALDASGLAAVVFYELIGWDPARAGEILAGAERRLDEVTRRRSPTGRVRVRLAAHAPHSVSPALFAGLVQRGGPAALHLAESPAESRFLASGDGEWHEFLARRGLGHVEYAPPGVSPVRHADSLGALHPGLVAAHCVQADRRDVALLARRGVHVALCPRSNHNLGVGTAPVRDFYEAGVRLCLGTDSLASVDTLDLIDDVALLHREHPFLDPALLVAMATRGGAEALGLDDLGVLASGRRAALAFAPAERPPRDPLTFLVSGEARPRRVEA